MQPLQRLSDEVSDDEQVGGDEVSDDEQENRTKIDELDAVTTTYIIFPSRVGLWMAQALDPTKNLLFLVNIASFENLLTASSSNSSV